jgi:mannose-6-phosphate isomerase-like protein (cupin superfamily)
LPTSSPFTYARGVDSADLRDLVEISEGEVVRKTLFETEHLWSQVISVDRNRSYGPVSDPQADAMLTIVAGEAVFLVDKRRKRMKQWGSVMVPAGAEVVVTNASPDPLVLLMVTAPPPLPRETSG